MSKLEDFERELEQIDDKIEELDRVLLNDFTKGELIEIIIYMNRGHKLIDCPIYKLKI